jgi:hypothetical protein
MPTYFHARGSAKEQDLRSPAESIRSPGMRAKGIAIAVVRGVKRDWPELAQVFARFRLARVQLTSKCGRLGRPLHHPGTALQGRQKHNVGLATLDSGSASGAASKFGSTLSPASHGPPMSPYCPRAVCSRPPPIARWQIQ